MKRTLYILALGIFGIATTEFGVIGILPQIAAAFKVSIDQAGWLLSAFALIIAVFGPFMMMLVCRFNRKTIMVLVLGIFAVSNVISALAINFNMLLFARILPAFMHPVFWSVSLTIAAGSVSIKESPKAVGIVFAGFTIASVLGIPLATFVADLSGWQASFILSAFINLLSFLGLLIYLPDLPATEIRHSDRQYEVLRKPILWINLVLACLMIAAMYATYGYMAEYLKRVTAMTGAQISLMLFFFGISGVGGNWLAGKYLSRNKNTTTFIFILLLALVHVVIYFLGNHFILMVGLICVWGLVHTGGFLISNVNVTSVANETPEFVNSLFTSCGNLAVTIGSVLGGWMITNKGVGEVPLASVILLILSLVVFIVKRINMQSFPSSEV
ncbi:MFS transporter [Pedobacter steynii]|uniref:Transporter n=1 Tax=Pedobacter steynii TaxID=430522 RepID=A0A1D7QEA2_9SPHI|nr:MFS transporter [Pedobacter steynii]AOM77011.1 transporter [Pedobacter steynii]